MRSERTKLRCDIFCSVVDNYGDIGVCWRLARQLVREQGIAIRLWVDDLASFKKLCSEVDIDALYQLCGEVEIINWTRDSTQHFLPLLPLNPQQQGRVQSPSATTGGVVSNTPKHRVDWVIEAFACKLPAKYVAWMTTLEPKPVWLNLEYLSAEDWVEGCHQLPSPHPVLPLVKYFFFPGFTVKTGGLLVEHDLLSRRNSFQQDLVQQQLFWQSINVPMPAADTLKISLFCYENAALNGLLDSWGRGDQPVLCLVPEGPVQSRIEQYFEKYLSESSTIETDENDDSSRHENRLRSFMRGHLQVLFLPFLEQDYYDKLLWACDINFVRGEDSFVRAQWAGKPFVWHIYPQHDGVHLHKLRAFMALYCAGLSAEAEQAFTIMWVSWNGETGSERFYPDDAGKAWAGFMKHQAELLQQANLWAEKLSANNLVLNLLDFFRSIDRMRDSENLA